MPVYNGKGGVIVGVCVFACFLGGVVVVLCALSVKYGYWNVDSFGWF